jgi:hypothetical protein
LPLERRTASQAPASKQQQQQQQPQQQLQQPRLKEQADHESWLTLANSEPEFPHDSTTQEYDEEDEGSAEETMFAKALRGVDDDSTMLQQVSADRSLTEPELREKLAKAGFAPATTERFIGQWRAQGQRLTTEQAFTLGQLAGATADSEQSSTAASAASAAAALPAPSRKQPPLLRMQPAQTASDDDGDMDLAAILEPAFKQFKASPMSLSERNSSLASRSVAVAATGKEPGAAFDAEPAQEDDASTLEWPDLDSLEEGDDITDEQLNVIVRKFNELGPLATAQASSPHAVGCSGGRQARELAPMACAANQLFCWHRCMNFTATVSPEYCRDVLNLRLQCGSQYGEISDGDQHGDYEIMCTNSTQTVTPHPTIPGPDDRDACARELAPLEARDRAEYASFRKLTATTYLAWSVTSDGWLRVKMLHNGTTGYLAFGLSGLPGMPKNGMHGAEIVMGIAREGGGAGSVNEYRVHETQTPFRFWNTTLESQSMRNATMQVSDCYAAMTFETKHFGSRAVELGGTNKVTWAVHTSTWPRGPRSFLPESLPS